MVYLLGKNMFSYSFFKSLSFSLNLWDEELLFTDIFSLEKVQWLKHCDYNND